MRTAVPGVYVGEMDGSGIDSEDRLLSAVAGALLFPDYSGNNWNAVLDCLRDFWWLESSGYVLVVTSAAEQLQRRLQGHVQPMRVKCIRLVNSISGESEARNPWLTVDREYVVLAVSVLPESGAMFRVVGDDGHTPALFEACQFAVTVADIPSVWKAMIAGDGGLELGPSSWLRSGFWEDYFDGSPDATADFEAARTAIIVESGRGR